MSITLVDSSFTIVPYNGQIYSSFPNGTFSGTLVRLNANASGTFAYTFGQAFKKGDVAQGAYLQTNSPNYQVNVLNRWSDGTVKFAVVNGTDTFVSGVDKTITVTTTPFPPSGTALTETDLLTVLGTSDVTLDLSGQGTVGLKDLVGVSADVAVSTSNGRLRTHISGAVMSEWHYRTTCGSSAHLRVYFYVRLYLGGQLEVEVMVENGYINVPSPTNLTYNATLTVNGTQRYYRASYLHYYRSRWTTINWWDGTDGTTDFQRVLPKHAWDYLTVTKMIPNYKWRNISDTVVAGWTQQLVPGSVCNLTQYMPTTGAHPDIGLSPQWAAACGSNKLGTVKTTIANAYALNSYSMCARDERTGYPIIYSANPNTSGYSGQEKNWQRYVTGTPNVWDHAHNPNAAYIAYLLTARWGLMETQQFNATYAYLADTGGARLYEKGVIKTQTRSNAWNIRNQACAAVMTPDLYADQQIEYVNCCYWNVWYSWSVCSDGAGVWKNSFGYGFQPTTYPTVTGYWGLATWQEGFRVQATGFAWDICAEDMMTTAQKTIYQETRDFFYNQPVGFMGSTGADDYNYTGNFKYAPTMGVAPFSSTAQNNYFTTWSQVYSMQFSNNTQPNPLGPGGVPNPGTGLGGTFSVTTVGTGTTSTYDPGNPTGYFANSLPGIAYAVSHGATGSAAAWERVKSATNFPNTSASLYDDKPQFGVFPYGE